MTTLSSGIGRITTILVCLLLTGMYAYSCVSRVESVAPPARKVIKPARPPKPAACGHLYNVGKHKQWADCMGVGYK